MKIARYQPGYYFFYNKPLQGYICVNLKIATRNSERFSFRGTDQCCPMVYFTLKYLSHVTFLFS